MKQFLKKTLIGSLILLFICFLVIVFYYFSEQRNVHYEDYKEAMVPGDGIPNGWIPKYLPTSATDINTFQDIDVNEVSWNKFKFKSGDDSSIRAKCSLLKTLGNIEYLLCEDRWCAVIDSKAGRGAFHSSETEVSCLEQSLDPE